MKQSADPILIEVLRNEMAAAAEEMAIAVYKTARSSMLRVGDFATSLADYQGRIVGLGQSHSMATSVFMNLMPHLMEKFAGNFKPGDVILANDPYSGASHMPDVILIMPVFHREALSGFVIIYSHQTDIGGRFPGGFSSQCMETYEEGIRLPNLKLYDAGVRNEPLVQLLKANVRANDEWMGDIDAKLSGCRRGIREFEAVSRSTGWTTSTPASITWSTTASRLPGGRLRRSRRATTRARSCCAMTALAAMAWRCRSN